VDRRRDAARERRNGFGPTWTESERAALAALSRISLSCTDARGGTRTRTGSPPGDFKSPAFAISPPGPRAGNGTRTRDPNLGKVVLYQLSYSRNSDSEPRLRKRGSSSARHRQH
jgi:hypothetical protein